MISFCLILGDGLLLQILPKIIGRIQDWKIAIFLKLFPIFFIIEHFFPELGNFGGMILVEIIIRLHFSLAKVIRSEWRVKKSAASSILNGRIPPLILYFFPSKIGLNFVNHVVLGKICIRWFEHCKHWKGQYILLWSISMDGAIA
jgi:hypothetical protein